MSTQHASYVIDNIVEQIALRRDIFSNHTVNEALGEEVEQTSPPRNEDETDDIQDTQAMISTSICHLKLDIQSMNDKEVLNAAIDDGESDDLEPNLVEKVFKSALKNNLLLLGPLPKMTTSDHEREMDLYRVQYPQLAARINRYISPDNICADLTNAVLVSRVITKVANMIMENNLFNKKIDHAITKVALKIAPKLEIR